LKSKRPIKACRTSRLSGLDIKSPRRRLSIRAQPLRNVAKLRAFVISGERSAYIRLFSSKNATPDFGLALKRASPVKISCFLDFACSNDSARMKSLDARVKAVPQNEHLRLPMAIVRQRCPMKEVSILRKDRVDNANIIGACGHVIHE
jgi:hypothetical protein